MIWTPDIVRHIRCLRARGSLSEEVMRRPGYHDGLRRLCWKSMNTMANSWAVDLDPEDIWLRPVTRPEVLERDRMLGQVTFEAYWEPRVFEVELMGGSARGEVHTRPPRDLFTDLAVHGAMVAVERFDDAVTVGPTQVLHYRYAGWNEKTRRWVFRIVE